MKIIGLDSGQWEEAEKKGFSQAEVEGVVKAAYNRASKLLPTLSTNLNIVIRPNKNNYIKETGDNGYTYDSELVIIEFSPTLPYGKEDLIKNMENAVFHECNHAARYRWLYSQGVFEPSIVDAGIHEGLATVFAGQYANGISPWGKYEDDETMNKWLEELRQADKNGEHWKDWGFDRADGRKWVGYKTGTWIVDKAIQNSGKSVIDLTSILSKDITELASL